MSWGAWAAVTAAATVFVVLEKKVRRWGGWGLKAAIGVLSAALLAALLLATSHGADPASVMERPVDTLVANALKSPLDAGFAKGADDTEEVLADSPTGLVAIFRPGCPDCAAVYDLFPEGSVTWVSSRCAVGRRLCEEYSVEEVPTFLAEGPDGWSTVDLDGAVERAAG